MENKIIIQNVNEVYVKIICEDGIAYELRETFKFKVPGYQFHPKYRARLWSGDIFLFDIRTRQIYRGLVPYIAKFCEERGYDWEYENGQYDEEFSLSEAEQFFKSLNLPIEPRDYQIEAFVHAIRTRRSLLLSPTASGKSLIIYLITRYINAKNTLIIVPTISLVSQLASDFDSYGYTSDKYVHRIFAGEDKETDKPITISTWQSLYKLPQKYFEKFDLVIGDECLHPDTLITMGDNTKKKICEIVIGDDVKTYNEHSKLLENKKVLKVHENISIQEDFYLVETEDGKELKITGNHKVLLTNGVWKQVKDLQIGEIINGIE
jgi:reverse gyrase